MKCLVTGISGFIGSHLADELLKNSHSVTGIDNFSFKNNTNIKNLISKVELIKSDYTDPYILNLIKQQKFDYIFHYAGKTGIKDSIDNICNSHIENVDKTLILLDACCNGNIKKFIFPSTSAVYGDSEELPVKENSDKNPISPYGLQKLIIEQYLYQYKLHKGLESIILRYSTVYGPRQRGLGNTNVIAKWLYRLANIDNVLIIDGDGNQARDFIHIKDVVDANLLALNFDTKETIFNISSNNSVSINCIANYISNNIVCNINGKKPEFLYENKKPGNAVKTQLDNSRARKFLNFNPSKINLEEEIIELYTWYCSNKVV